MIYTEDAYKKAKDDDVFEFVCPICGLKFYRTKRCISKNGGTIPKYCSQKCYRLSRKAEKVKVICKNCGKEYYLDATVYNRKIKNGSEFFCSRSCAASYNNKIYPKKKKTSTSHICPNCGNQKSNHAEYCRACQTRFNSESILNRELGYYIGYEHRKSYTARRCVDIRKSARKIMESNTSIEKVCAICHNHEFDSILEVHHIKSICSFDPHTKISAINDIKNLIWLCPNHHRMVEIGEITL